MSKTPKLRFNEFSGDWEKKKLSTYTEKITRKNKGFLVNNVISNSAKNGLVSQRDFFDKDIANQNNIDGYYIIENGNFVYNPRKSLESPYGPINRYNLEDAGVVSPLYLCFKINEKVNGKFLEYYFKSSKWYRFIYQNSDQGARHDRVSIKDSEFFKLNVKFPYIEEQEKISSFFSLIDDKISLQSEKLERLKDYKKGMIQKIFSRELRFKDGNGRNYTEWEEKNLGKLIKVKSNRNKDSIVGLVLSVSNTKGFITQSEQFEDRVVASSDISNYKIVEKNDFAFNPSRINVGSIARLKLYDKGIISPMYICFKCLDSLDSEYLEYFLRTHSFDVQMKKKLEGSVRQTLSADALGEIVINLPCLDEQKKIGKFLNNIDEKINKEQEKLDYLNEYKKGLLQQMFV